MARRDVVDAVTNQKQDIDATIKKNIAIAAPVKKADFEKIISSENLTQGSSQFAIIQSFCNEKKASSKEANALVQRIKNVSDEKLKILELLSQKKNFSAKDILNSIPSVRKFPDNRLLLLSTFCGLDGIGPGPLYQFFRTTLPQCSQKEVGQEAYLNELKEKLIRADQINVFYNLCTYIEGIKPRTAVAILPKIKQLEPQHAQVISTYFNKNVVFGKKPIIEDNILGLLNLWLDLPIIDDDSAFKRYMNKLSKASKKIKNDFQHIIFLYKEEIAKMEKGGNILNNFRNLFD